MPRIKVTAADHEVGFTNVTTDGKLVPWVAAEFEDNADILGLELYHLPLYERSERMSSYDQLELTPTRITAVAEYRRHMQDHPRDVYIAYLDSYQSKGVTVNSDTWVSHVPYKLEEHSDVSVHYLVAEDGAELDAYSRCRVFFANQTSGYGVMPILFVEASVLSGACQMFENTSYARWDDVRVDETSPLFSSRSGVGGRGQQDESHLYATIMGDEDGGAGGMGSRYGVPRHALSGELLPGTEGFLRRGRPPWAKWLVHLREERFVQLFGTENVTVRGVGHISHLYTTALFFSFILAATVTYSQFAYSVYSGVSF